MYSESHHHHHVVPLARISLTLSCHFSRSFITSGRSSGLHPVSSHSCCMYVLAGHLALARPYVGVHRSTSLMSSSLLLQQCPACFLFISMETTTYMGSMFTPLDRASFQLQNTIFTHSHHYWLCLFANNEQGFWCLYNKRHTLKVLLPIYFNGNYNRYEQQQNTIFHIVTIIIYTFLLVMSKSLHDILIRGLL